MQSAISVFAYNDFRRYLKEHFAALKEARPSFSHRFLLRKMGITSSGFLANVISGKRNLPHVHASALAEALGLGRKAGRYFETLVAFNQAKKTADKARLFRELLAQKPADLQTLEGAQLRLFSTWYHVAIRELAFFHPLHHDYAALARKLLPAIRPGEAKAAVEDLLAAGLLERDRRGALRQRQAVLSTGDQVRSVQAAAYQRATMDLAKEAIDRVDAADRDISTLTLTLSDAAFRAAVEEIRSLRKRLLRLAVDEPAPDRVFQCNLQIFPVTRK
jgi:uncharacterized protein (TIGR02147 family)